MNTLKYPELTEKEEGRRNTCYSHMPSPCTLASSDFGGSATESNTFSSGDQGVKHHHFFLPELMPKVLTSA